MSMNMSKHILIIDDEPDIRGLLSMTIERMGHKTTCAANTKSAIQTLNEHQFDLCLTDLKLPDGSGIDIVKLIQTQHTQLPVIVITAHGSMDIAIEAMKEGAFDFLNKPVDLNNLRTLITSALSTPTPKSTQQTDINIVGNSVITQKLKDNIAKVARSQAPVFICGESGSGKELVARAIHKLSSRYEFPFIAVNCGAIPKELMESEFFGHTKGSFTGAHQDKEGLFQSAEGGTLFLDEVADLPMDMQVKLLRAIQEKTIRPIGSQKEININVRILSATHKHLLSAINEGSFRNDLYYRINVIEINVPPLRERLEDIHLLTQVLLDKIAEKNNTSSANISKPALTALSQYSFPGNVRELENILERACALCGPEGIEAGDLQLDNQKEPIKPIATNSSQQHDSPIPNHSDISNNPAGPQKYEPGKMTIDEYLDNIEKDIILEALESNRWNRTSTAKLLGVTFRSLRYRMKKLGIDDD